MKKLGIGILIAIFIIALVSESKAETLDPTLRYISNQYSYELRDTYKTSLSCGDTFYTLRHKDDYEDTKVYVCLNNLQNISKCDIRSVEASETRLKEISDVVDEITKQFQSEGHYGIDVAFIVDNYKIYYTTRTGWIRGY